MFLAVIGTAGVISAYFFRHVPSAYILNVSDPIEGQPVQLSYYLFAFGCGLVFWLLVLLWAKLHGSSGHDRQADIRKVAKLAVLITSITALNLYGCLRSPFIKLPLLVRFLVPFQMSSNLALLLLLAFLSLKSSPKPLQYGYSPLPKSPRYSMGFNYHGGEIMQFTADGVGGDGDEDEDGVDEEENEEHGGDGNEDEDSDVGVLDPEVGERETSTEHAFNRSKITEVGVRETSTELVFNRSTSTEHAFNRSKITKITEMSLMLSAQAICTLVGFHGKPTPSSSSKDLLVVALMDQLVAFLCGLTSILLSSNETEDSEAAKIFANIGFVCTALGFILMVAMFVLWYFVLIAVLLFGVVWLIFFRNELETYATNVRNHLSSFGTNLRNRCMGLPEG